MRNLKRALSLVMATAMLLGMMVIGAGAVSIDDFADKGDIVNKEAVALMVDLGIIEGKSPTSYDPKGTMERAAVAKLVYYVKMGNADESVYKGLDTGLNDVNGKTWAEGFINYCVGAGIIDGVGGGKFNPTGKLTVAATAKVLLVTLGYDADDRGYTGNTYAIRVMDDANNNGLLVGIDQGANQAITRDNAARMFFNALFAPTRTANYGRDMGDRYVTGYTPTGKTLGEQTYGLQKVTGTVTGIVGGKASLSLSASNTLTGVTYNNVLPATPDMIGSNVNFYVRGTSTFTAATGVTAVTATGMYSTSLAAGANNTLYSITGPVGAAGLKNQAAITALESAGVVALDSVASSLTYYYLGGASATDIGGRGVEVALKDTDGNGKVDSVVVTKKTAAVLSVAPTVATTGGKTTVTIAQLGIANAAPANVVGYEGLEKGDVVLYVQVGGVTYIEKAEKLTGTVSGNNATRGALINGQYYLPSELTGVSYVKGSINNTATYDFYLDGANNILVATPVGTAAAATTLAVVGATSWVKINNTGDLGAASSSFLQARLINTDGTAELVRVASINGYTPVAAGTTFAALGGTTYTQNATLATVEAATSGSVVNTDAVAAGEYSKIFNAAGNCIGKFVGVTDTAGSSINVPAADGNPAKTVITHGGFYNYSVNAAGNYVLSNLNAATQGANTALTAQITNNGAGGVFHTGLVGNNATLFIYAVTDPATGAVSYSTYTGVANVPTTAAAVSGFALKNAQGYVTHVFADLGTNGTVTGSADLVYILSADYTQITGTTNYVYNVLLNGTATTLTLNANTYVAGGVYPVSSISASNVYTLGAQANSTPVVGIKANAGGTIVLKDGTVAYRYESGTPAYIIENGVATTTTMDALTLNASNEVHVNAINGVATVAYVTVKSQAPTSVVLAAGAGTDKATVASGNLHTAAGSVTGWVAGTADKVTITVTAAAGTTVDSISVNGATVPTDGTEFALTQTGVNTVVVTVKDDNSGALSSTNYSFTVAAPAPTPGG